MAKVVYLTKGQKSRKKKRMLQTSFWRRISIGLLLLILAQNAYILYVTTNL
jgi:hypothetical protein